MKYADILPDVLAGKWVRNHQNLERWLKMDENGHWHTEDGTMVDLPRNSYSFDTWEVKPEIDIVLSAEDMFGHMINPPVYSEEAIEYGKAMHQNGSLNQPHEEV